MNTIASDTLVEAIARAMADEMKSNSVYVSDDLRNCLIDGGLFDLHGTAQAALTAITEAGYAVVPVDTLGRAIETLAASRHLIGKYTPDHHWLPEHDQRIAELRAATNNGKAE